MNLIVEGAKSQGDESYSVTIRLAGIPDRETCEAMSMVMAEAVAWALAEMGANAVEVVTAY